MNTKKINAKQTKMIAHRGLSGIERENTCSAFVAAGNRSYFGIETDIHVTKDNGFVIFHDDNTARVGLDSLEIEQSTFQTLRSLQLTDTDGLRGRIDLRIPSLSEYIGICAKYEKTAVLELKNRMTKEQIASIAAQIDKMHDLQQVIFISFSLENLIDLRSLYPQQTVQFLTETYSDELLLQLQELGMDLDILYTELTEERVAAIHEKGIKLNCWTCDNPEYAENLANWGIDYITSNILE